MRKIKLTFLLFLLCVPTVLGQSAEEIVIRQFGNNLRDWCSTKDTDYRMRAQKQCTDACRVKDKIMEDFVANSGLDIKDYVVPNYLNGFENALGNGQLFVNFYNVKTVSKNEWDVVPYYGNSTSNKKMFNEIVTVACQITVKGTLNYQIEDLFYLQKGKIVKITPYEKVVDPQTGKTKVKVDFSDFSDLFWVKERQLDAVGVSLGYSNIFPLNIGVYRNISYLNIGIEVGGAFGNTIVKEYESRGIDVYDKGFYLLATPGLFLGYLTFNCGAGVVALREKFMNSNVSAGSTKFYGILKPSVEFNIPLSIGKDKYRSFDFMLCPRIAYNYVLKVKSMNCWEFGLCFRYYYGG